MNSIQEVQTTLYQLLKPDLNKKFYQISMDGMCVASLDLINGEGSLARIETKDGSYTIKRQGFFLPIVSIRRDKSDVDISTAMLDIRSKINIVLDGMSYTFRFFELWKNQWGWVNDKNKPIVRYKLTNAGIIRGDIELSKEAIYMSNLALIITIGVYFLIQFEEELIKINDYGR